MKNRSLTLTQYQCLSEFRYHIRRYLHFNERVARSSGMEPRQHEVLLLLKGLPEDMRPCVRSVADRLQIRHHSAVELVKRLTQRGYLRRKRGEDRREVMLRLTASGERQLNSLAENYAEGHKEAVALQRALKRVLQVCQAARR
jgi:DNA-binding MarR family transcriptional regulator